MLCLYVLIYGSEARDWFYTPFASVVGEGGKDLFRVRKVILSVLIFTLLAQVYIMDHGLQF
jgi:hypothetical protein